VTSAQLVDKYTARVNAYDQVGPYINAIRDLSPTASAIAQDLDLLRQMGKGGGLLFGVPILLKDNINTIDEPTTAGSLALESSIPLDDAFITAQLRQAGAIVLAKGNLTEFANYLALAMPSGYSSLGDFVANPYDPRRSPLSGQPILSPGGSSSGPGAAGAASFAAATIGTETSGSILSPSSQNSLAGVKPTVGLASRTGIIPIASSQDTAGPLARTVTDAAIMLGAITAVDPTDPATQVDGRIVYSDYTQFLDANALQGAHIGIAAQRDVFGGLTYFNSPGTALVNLMNAAADQMRKSGATVVTVEILTADALNSFNSTVLSYE